MHTYKDKLKEILSQIATCEEYFGEFATPGKIQIDKSKLPIIYVDFLGENPISSYELKLEFSLYIAHVAFSKNKNTREKSQSEVSTLLININKNLYAQFLENSQPIQLKQSKKILDTKVENSYITIFKKNLEFIIPKHHTQGELIE